MKIIANGKAVEHSPPWVIAGGVMAVLVGVGLVLRGVWGLPGWLLGRVARD